MQFGGLRAVDALSMTAAPARITALIGPNGAGKTTALNMLSGFYRASAGSFALGAQALGGRSAWRIARAGVARTYQTSQLFGSLSVEENVALAARRGRLGPLLGAAGLRADDARRRAAELLDVLRLCRPARRPRRRPGRMSTGAWSRSRARSRSTPRCCCSTSPRPASRAPTRRGSPACCSGSPTPA